MAIVDRPSREDELARAEELVTASINDLTLRHGFGRMATVRPPHFQSFSLKDDPDGLWVADDGGEILGFAFSGSAAGFGSWRNCSWRRASKAAVWAMHC
jgi:hypothetical protein